MILWKIQNILKPFGEWGIKLKKNKQDDFSVFQRKIAIRFFGSAVLSVLIVVAIYLFLWKRRLGDFIVYLLEFFLQMEHEEAFLIYHNNFRGYKET